MEKLRLESAAHAMAKWSIGPSPKSPGDPGKMIRMIRMIRTFRKGKVPFSSDLRLESDEKRDFEFSHGATRFRFHAYKFERAAFWMV